MPINKNAVLRYNALDKCFSNSGRKYYFDDLLSFVNDMLLDEHPNSTGIQVRQLREDIRFMKSESGYAAPIEAYREGKKAFYRYSDSNFSINQSPLNHSEAEQLRSAISIIQRFEGSPEFEWVNEIGPLLKDQFGFKSDERKIIGYESNIDYSGYEYISLLFNAISNKRVLKIIYKSFGKGEFQFNFHPYYLKQFNNRWFVFGRNEGNNVNQWTIPLDRIKELDEIDAEYTNDETDWEDYFYDIIGVTKPINREIEKVELLVSKEQAPYLITKPLHASQRVCNVEDGSVRITIDVIPNYELEKTFVFLTALLKKLPYTRSNLPLDVVNDIELDSYKIQHKFTTDLQLSTGDGEDEGMQPGGAGRPDDDELDLLTQIIKVLNDTFGLELTDEDKVEFDKMKDSIYSNDELMSYFNDKNSKGNIQDKFNEVIDDELLNFIDAKLDFYNKMTDDKANQLFKRMWFNELYNRQVRGISKL